ncbi:MAG: signal peptidase I [Clostridia bacterium]|nr:signal peptidase I [Clostridia bacterium]
MENQVKKPINYKKIWEVTKTVLVWMIVAFAVLMMIFTLVSVNMFDQNERNIFGYKFFVVRSDSMAATDFKAGDIVISKVVDTTTLKEGDIITFISENPDNYGETVTHKIREVTTDQYGSVAFVTYGTTTGEDDEALATYVVGKYVGKLPNLGAFFLFLKTTPGYIICILVPFLLLILSQGINTIRLFRAYKKEQMDQMNAEKAKIEAERAESQRMMAELLELKKQLAQQTASTEEKTDTPDGE